MISERERNIFIISIKVECVNASDGSNEDASGRVQSVADIQAGVIVINYTAKLTKWRRSTNIEKYAFVTIV